MPWYAPWIRSEPPSDAPPDDREPGQHITAQVAALEARLSQLTADLAGLRLEWAEVLAKLNRWAGRQAAAERRRVQQVDHLSPDGLEIAEDAPGATNGAPATSSSQADRLAAKAALRAKIRR